MPTSTLPPTATLVPTSTELPTATPLPPTSTPSLSEYESQLERAFGASQGIELVENVRLVNSSNARYVVQTQLRVADGYNNSDTADSLRWITQGTLGTDGFDLLVFLNDGTTLSNYLWSGAVQTWTASNATEPPPSTSTPSVTPTDVVQSTTPQTYYLRVGSANMRACPRLSCTIISPLVRNDAVTVVGFAQGEVVSGSDIWFAVHFGSYRGFVHSTLLSITRAVTAVPPTSTFPPTIVPILISPTPVPYVAPANPGGDTSGGILCADGTVSHAAHRQGACSHHGGIMPGY